MIGQMTVKTVIAQCREIFPSFLNRTVGLKIGN